jgi:hypothetical protein
MAQGRSERLTKHPVAVDQRNYCRVSRVDVEYHLTAKRAAEQRIGCAEGIAR